MLKSKVQLVLALKGKLREFPALVDKLEKKDSLFVSSLIHWLKATEGILTTYNISEVAELSGFRSKIISTRFVEVPGGRTKKNELKIAGEILFDCQKTVLLVLKPIELKIEESCELIRQLLQIISQTKAIKYDPHSAFETLVSDIWNFIVTNDQLKAGAVKLKTNLPLTDIHLLFAQEIDLKDF